jgi:hypothetical protein
MALVFMGSLASASTFAAASIPQCLRSKLVAGTNCLMI